MKTITQIGSAVGLALTLGACGTLYKLDVAAYRSSGDDVGNTYVILSADPTMTVNSPEFELAAGQLERALETKGFQRLSGDELTDAALGIYVSTNMSDPSKVYHQIRTPVYRAATTETLGSADRDNGGSSPTPAGGPNGYPNALPTQAPTENFEGYKTASFAKTVYTKQLNLIAVDLQRYLKDIESLGRSKASPIEVWSVDIESTGQPSNMSDAIPIMIAAAQPYIAAETGEVVRVNLSETDRRVGKIKGN